MRCLIEGVACKIELKACLKREIPFISLDELKRNVIVEKNIVKNIFNRNYIAVREMLQKHDLILKQLKT